MFKKLLLLVQKVHLCNHHSEKTTTRSSTKSLIKVVDKDKYARCKSVPAKPNTDLEPSWKKRPWKTAPELDHVCIFA
jgi:hypothetical protein